MSVEAHTQRSLSTRSGRLSLDRVQRQAMICILLCILQSLLPRSSIRTRGSVACRHLLPIRLEYFVGRGRRVNGPNQMKIFISQTVDGFIAGNGDSLDHLKPFEGNDYG
jgi:hypothetical protein